MDTKATGNALQQAVNTMPERSVTTAEIAHYKEHGWVLLKGFLPRPIVDEILGMGQDAMGEDGNRTPVPGKFTYYNSLPMRGMGNPLLEQVLRHYARGAVALADRRANPGVRYFKDTIAVKIPTHERTGHGRSEWHQDFAAQVADRSGGKVFGTPLTDMGPENGTMSYLSGSHRQGVMGDYRTYGGGDLLDCYPELRETCEQSEYMTLEVGDVVVHSDLCMHEAGANRSNRPRWTYLVILTPADARWTGAPAISFDTDGLEQLATLDDVRFPRIG